MKPKDRLARMEAEALQLAKASIYSRAKVGNVLCDFRSGEPVYLYFERKPEIVYKEVRVTRDDALSVLKAQQTARIK